MMWPISKAPSFQLMKLLERNRMPIKINDRRRPRENGQTLLLFVLFAFVALLFV